MNIKFLLNNLFQGQRGILIKEYIWKGKVFSSFGIFTWWCKNLWHVFCWFWCFLWWVTILTFNLNLDIRSWPKLTFLIFGQSSGILLCFTSKTWYLTFCCSKVGLTMCWLPVHRLTFCLLVENAQKASKMIILLPKSILCSNFLHECKIWIKDSKWLSN